VACGGLRIWGYPGAIERRRERQASEASPKLPLLLLSIKAATATNASSTDEHSEYPLSLTSQKAV